MKTPEEVLEDNGYDIDYLRDENTILLRNPDYSSAIIGISSDSRIIYDYYKMIEYLIITEKMTYNDAADFISYNTIRAIDYFPEKKPIIMYNIIN